MKEIMLRRIPLMLLLAIQVLGGGAVTLAHARDVVVAQAGVEASHTARCAILHDEVRCALCHYASARVVTQQAIVGLSVPVQRVRFTPAPTVNAPVATLTTTTSPRAPPPALS